MAPGEDVRADLMDALGHDFGDSALLAEALTHASAAAQSEVPTYERLEFLGDRVLGLVVAERLFHRFPDDPEGDLARRHAVLVSRKTLALVAVDLRLAECLNMPKGETEAGTHRRPTILADACEALIGALYVDGGLETARGFILRHWDQLIEEVPPTEPKTRLQEWAQARAKGLPHYRTIRTEGPAHDPVFTVEVAVDGLAPTQAKGGSKRVAEQEAARQMLEALETTGATGDGD